jgi:hypothetical protein
VTPQPLPYETEPSEIAVKIQANLRNPNIRFATQAILRPGPKVYRYATLYEIIDSNTQQHHHWCLRIDTISRTKKAGWQSKPEKSVTLESDGTDELGDLLKLLDAALRGHLPARSGDYHIVDASGIVPVRQILALVREAKAEKKLDVVKSVLSSLQLDSLSADHWIALFESGPSLAQTVALAARLVQYRRELEALKILIGDPSTSEAALQRHLTGCPWMFGSEFSAVVERRTWTRDDRLDFLMRRTVDGYHEIIEIKTAFSQPLFTHDSGRDVYSPSKPLASAIGQVVRYIEEVERSRDTILAKDGTDLLKVRARVILGRSGASEQLKALRSLNGHLHRIEILTFDQLVLIAERVLEVMAGALGTEDNVRSA